MVRGKGGSRVSKNAPTPTRDDVEPIAHAPADWRELVETQWCDAVGRSAADVLTCGIYLTSRGLELHAHDTRREIATITVGRQLARQWRREFLFRKRRYEELAREEREAT
jgi:hypothetical protein